MNDLQPLAAKSPADFKQRLKKTLQQVDCSFEDIFVNLSSITAAGNPVR